MPIHRRLPKRGFKNPFRKEYSVVNVGDLSRFDPHTQLDPDALKDESKTRKFAWLIRTYCQTGGFLVQFNIVSSEMLRDAQRNPEEYRDLLVRVATYSAYFTELSPELQNDIIARMEFDQV